MKEAEEGGKVVLCAAGNAAVLPGAGGVILAHVEGPIKAAQGDGVGAVGAVLKGFGSLAGGIIGFCVGGPPGAVVGAGMGYAAGCGGQAGVKKLTDK